MRRGAAPVDPTSVYVGERLRYIICIFDSLKSCSKATHQVLSNESGVWDAMLNQTDVSQNQNKNKLLLEFITFIMINCFHVLLDSTSCSFCILSETHLHAYYLRGGVESAKMGKIKRK